MQLREIAPETYARDVLPSTAPLWAGRRSFERYVAQTLELARSTYGKRHYRTLGLYEGGELLSSFKRYERELHDGASRLRGFGFGAVFTPAAYRGRGYASFMLASALDGARKEGYDVAFLFSDIHPAFYATLGFRALPSRKLTLRADALPSRRLPIAPLDSADASGVRRCFERQELRRASGFLRSPSLWAWIAMRERHENEAGRGTNLAYRRRGLAAYVLGARVPERDAYVVEEYGYADDDDAAILPALLRAAAGDLRRIVGWLPPDWAREALPKGVTRKRTRAIFMMAPLNRRGGRLIDAIAAPSSGDFCWATDHI